MQSILVAKTTAYIKEKFNANVSIRRIDVQLFNRILLRDVLIEDISKDTLIAAKAIKVSILWFNNDANVLKFKRVNINDAYINFSIDSSGSLNLETLLNKIFPPDTILRPPSAQPFALEIKNIKIENSRFRLCSNKPRKQEKGINFEDMDLSNLNVDARDFGLHRDTISLIVNDLNFVEKSGFKAEKVRAEFSMCRHHMYFDKLRIKAHGSYLQLPYFRMNFDGMDKMSSFLQNVNLDMKFDNSLIKTQTIGYIVPELGKIDIEAVLNGRVNGTISDIRAKNLIITTGTQTKIVTNFHLTGLPNIERTLMIVDFKELSTSLNDIEQFKYSETQKPIVSLPAEFNRLNKITYKGNFTGFINNFVAFGSISTAIGKLSLDLSIKPDTIQNTEFNGNISTSNLHLGELIGTSSIGRISLNAMIKGTSDKDANIDAYTDATVNELEANAYNYSNIKINGNLTNRTYEGTVALDDPNCKLNFVGKVDFSDSIPVFDFSAFVPNIDLVKLNFNTSDTISQASFLFTAKISGSSLDNSKGEIKLLNTWYKNQIGEFKLSDITIFADNNKDSKLVTLQSEFAEGELRSKYNYSKIFENLQKLIYKYVPAIDKSDKTANYSENKSDNPEFNDYIIKFRTKKSKKITDVLLPNIRVAENTSIFGIFNPDLNTFTLKIKIPELALGSNIFKDILIDGQTKDSIFEASISTPMLNLGGSIIRNISLQANVENNNLDLTFGWDNKQTPINKGSIKAFVNFNPSLSNEKSTAKIDFKLSEFVINDSIWTISPSFINFDSSNIAIDRFNIHNQNQSLLITGNISNNPSDSILVTLENIDVSNLNFYLKSIGYEIGGRLNGFAKINDIYNNQSLYADLGISRFTANNRPIGDLKFDSEWFSAEKKLSLNLTNSKNDTLTFETKGNIYTESNKIDFIIDINRIQLEHFSPLLAGVVSDLAGSINGNLKLTGTSKKPILNGALNIEKGTLTVDFMKVPYTINDRVDFKNSDIILKNFKIIDPKDNIAVINGGIKTGYFKDFNLNLNISPSNFLCINTAEKDNELFYGTVFASGLVSITGKPDDINMNIAVRTDNNTILFLPLSSSNVVSKNNFITFTSKNSDEIFIEEATPIAEENHTKMNLSFDLQVTPDAEVQIIIDKKLGDIIKARGSGNLKMDVNPGKDLFKIYGDYLIERGDYLFTLQGVINKKFKIDAGSSLSWDGDPTDATMNIKAIYSVRTPLKDLLYDYSGKYDNRIPVNCQIQLTQKLMAPGIRFGIDVPNTDSETKSLIESALVTEDNINKQFLSLLVINSFLPPSKDIVEQNSPTAASNNSNNGLTSGLGNSLSELLSNQLSNWISQWSENFEFGFNYRPGTDANNISSDQYELAVSTQLLDDRVTINGNVNYGNRSNASSIAGDFNFELKLNKSGKLRLKGFARSNDDILTTTSTQTYTTGAGIVYREDFNNFRDLIYRIKNTFNQEPVIVPLKEQVPQKADSTSQKRTEAFLSFPIKKNNK